MYEMHAANLCSMLALSKQEPQSKSQSNTRLMIQPKGQIRMVSKKGRCISSYKCHFILAGALGPLRSCKTGFVYNSIGSSNTSIHHIFRVSRLCIRMCLSRGSRLGIGCICTHRYPNLGWCMSLVSLISVRSINLSGSRTHFSLIFGLFLQ